MSLVTTAISKRSRSARHSANVNAVLPEPTGPPIPTRSGWVRITASLKCKAYLPRRTRREREETDERGHPRLSQPVTSVRELGLQSRLYFPRQSFLLRVPSCPSW